MPGIQRWAARGLVGLAIACGNMARARDGVIVSIPLGSDSMGVAHKRLQDTFQRMFDLAGQKAGFKIGLEILPSYEEGPQRGKYGDAVAVEESIKRLKAGSIDMLYLYPEDYFLHPQIRAMAVPVFSWTIQRKNKGRTCLYVNKKKGFRDVKSLRGKSFNNLVDYVTIRHLLNSKGVDEPLWKFFGKISFESNPLMSLDELVSGKVDVAYMSWQKWLLASKQKPVYKDLMPFSCLENQPLVMLGQRKGIDPKKSGIITQMLLTAHRDPHMMPVRWFFAAFNGQFFKLPPDYLKDFEAMFRQAEKKGWTKEAMTWFKIESPKRYKAWLTGG